MAHKSNNKSKKFPSIELKHKPAAKCKDGVCCFCSACTAFNTLCTSLATAGEIEEVLQASNSYAELAGSYHNTGLLLPNPSSEWDTKIRKTLHCQNQRWHIDDALPKSTKNL